MQCNKKVLIRADAGKDMGGGHVKRCMTLAECLLSLGWDCTFRTVQQTQQIVPGITHGAWHVEEIEVPLQNATCEVSGVNSSQQYDLAIVDHYGLNEEYENSLKQFCHRVAVFEDIAMRRHKADLLIDQTFGRLPAEYSGLVDPNCTLLCGSQFVVLPPQFAEQHKVALDERMSRRSANRILVTMGYTDPYAISELVLKSLKNLDAPGLIIDIVVGLESTATPLRSLAQQFQGKVNIHTALPELSSLMMAADIAIGAGGTTSWERACLGLPTLLVTVADNQKDVAKALETVGAAIHLGDRTEIDAEKICDTVSELLNNPEMRASMSTACWKICDGNGTTRIADSLEILCTGKSMSI